MTIFKFTIFKASVFILPSSLLAIFLILEGSIILLSRSLLKSKVYFLTLNGHLAIFDFDICHPCTWATRVKLQWHRLNIG
jgi:hypothetical protein